MLIDWLAAGLNPGVSTLFVQSHVPEHAELHLLLSMITPLGWLERVPTLQGPAGSAQGKRSRDLRLPRLSAAAERRHPALSPGLRPGRRRPGRARGDHARDRAALQPSLRPRAGLRDQGREGGEEARRPQRDDVQAAAHASSRRRGDQLALETRAALVAGNKRLTVADRERLLGYLEGGGVSILPEPQVLLTATPKVPGLDGRKMSKSYGNTIGLREDPDEVATKMRTMQTDPARVRRTDPGNPDKCPVFDLHKIYSERCDPRLGGERLPHGRHRLPRLQEAADREGGRGDQRHAQARAGIRGESGARAQHRRAKGPKGARGGARHARRSAPRHESAGGLRRPMA